MEGYGAPTFGDRAAEVYDELLAVRGTDPDAAADLLAELAGPGPALELAIGTGRIALPLADRGVEVHGIDASEAMVARMREKPGGADIPVTIGDFADVGVDGRYPLVFVVFNTFFALMTQEDQLRCFANVAEHLAEHGSFVIEAFVPDLTRFDRGQRVHAQSVELERAELELSVHDAVAQTVRSQLVVVTAEGMRLVPIFIRYAWPSELDLMARLAGLRLAERWAGWGREPFDGSSGMHVSVYRLA